MQNEHTERWIGMHRLWRRDWRLRESRRRAVARVRIWTPNCLFRLIADRQRTAAKGLARLFRLLSKGPFNLDSSFRAIAIAGGFPQN